MNTKKKNLKALTLVELMIVVGILSLLVGIGIPGWIRTRDRARRDTCINNLRMLESAADQFRIDNNLTTSDDVALTSLWPSVAGTKDISSYVTRQLNCPVDGAAYTGGAADGSLKATIEASGVPHCATSGARTNAGTDLEHSIESDPS